MHHDLISLSIPYLYSLQGTDKMPNQRVSLQPFSFIQPHTLYACLYLRAWQAGCIIIDHHQQADGRHCLQTYLEEHLGSQERHLAGNDIYHPSLIPFPTEHQVNLRDDAANLECHDQSA